MQQSMQRHMQPRTPPQPYVAEVKYEVSSPRSTSQTKRKPTMPTPDEASSTGSPNVSHSTGGPTTPDEDRAHIDTLISAMMDGTEAQDNDGMIKTWNKISQNNEAKLEEKCTQFLILLKEAQQQTIGEKKSFNQYENFQARFEAMCNTLRTQKTVCKHLLEPDYSHTVANDPIYAATKKQAINVGRKIMGQRGQGKGRKVGAIPEDELPSDDPFVSDEDANLVDNIKPEPRSEPRRIRKAKRNHRRVDGDDSDYREGKPASKKSKRGTRKSVYEVKKVNGTDVMVDTSDDRGMQAMTSSPAQNDGVHYEIQHPYAPILPAKQSHHQNGHHNGFDQSHGQQYNGYPQQYGYSSGPEPASSPQEYHYHSGANDTPSDDFNGNGTYSSDADAYEDYPIGPVSYEGEYGNIPDTVY
ncbi:hypothetical protein P7C71_g5107, partial [Lecanoromycetidae sp. Uapishka_2]